MVVPGARGRARTRAYRRVAIGQVAVVIAGHRPLDLRVGRGRKAHGHVHGEIDAHRGSWEGQTRRLGALMHVARHRSRRHTVARGASVARRAAQTVGV